MFNKILIFCFVILFSFSFLQAKAKLAKLEEYTLYFSKGVNRLKK
ncbi:MAG: hypothetical protein P1P59_01835 [Treponemataceae bacterium]